MAKDTAEFSFETEASEGVSLQMGSDGGEDIRHEQPSVGVDTSDVDFDDADDQGDTGLVGDDNDAGDAPPEAETVAEELPDFDAEDPEVVDKYESRYLAADGSLDAEGALSAEYFANVEKGVDGLNESTYAYLATKGITKATVKQIEAMAATSRDAKKDSVVASDLKLFEIAGGPDQLKAALSWGKEGGYSKEQQERFNKLTSGKDAAAKQEAVELLMSRFNKANPPERPRLPQRDGTKGQGTLNASVKPFATRQEMREARAKLRQGDLKAKKQFDARHAVSKFET